MPVRANKRYTNADDYLNVLPSAARATLEKLRQTIRKAAPEAEEVISYGIPAFRLHGMLVWFAAFKNHCSLFARHQVVSTFEKDLEPYETTKSAIKFPLDGPVPVNLVTKIVKFAAEKNLERLRSREKPAHK